MRNEKKFDLQSQISVYFRTELFSTIYLRSRRI